MILTSPHPQNPSFNPTPRSSPPPFFSFSSSTTTTSSPPMTAQVLHSPSHLPTSSPPAPRPAAREGSELGLSLGGDDKGGGGGKEEEQLSLLALLVAVFRKSLVGCRTAGREELCAGMEIGCPTDVRHVAHVTFDRFNGFLGLPQEFEPEVPRRAPSASASVFGVSTESMQLSYDSRGNSVPTILLLMQRRLYSLGGLQAEGIFRINAENGQEEYVRDQLNRGIVPDGIDVHCLAGLIKAWFRELPRGVLDSLSPEQVMQCQTEEECAQLVRLLPPTEAALLDWAINLMADVVQEEHHNKMNARNVAMVFAPNMTQMDDPLTALMYAVQVMNFLKTLIVKMLREREDAVVGDVVPACHSDPSNENGHQSPSEPCLEAMANEELANHVFVTDEPDLNGQSDPATESNRQDDTKDISNLPEKALPGSYTPEETQGDLAQDTDVNAANDSQQGDAQRTLRKSKSGQSSKSNLKKAPRKINGPHLIRVASSVEKSKGASLVSRINSRPERVEAWR